MAASIFPFTQEGGCMMRHVLCAFARFEAHWVSDAVGVICLFAMGYAGLLIGCGLGLK